MIKEIYFAGGCFWGAEKYLALIPGVTATKVGYANGKTENPTYKDVCEGDTGHVETVWVQYDADQIRLPFLLELFFDAIDPTTKDKQGGDIGTQYRSGVYYTAQKDQQIINDAILQLGKQYTEPIVVEVLPLMNFYSAEVYHQKYLDKNPGGYCHIGEDMFAKAKQAVESR